MYKIEEIILSPTLKIWKSQFDTSRLNEMIDDCNKIFINNKKIKNDSYVIFFERKIETSDFFNLEGKKSLDYLRDFAANVCILLKNKPFSKIYLEAWINVLKSKNPVQVNYDKNNNLIFHNHVDLNDKFNHPFPEYTFICYIQMPNNLVDNDGVLYIKSKEDIVYSILPKEGEILIFDSNIDHVPNYAPNSTLDRIVLAGNIRTTNTKFNKTII